MGLWRFPDGILSLESPGFKCVCWETMIASLFLEGDRVVHNLERRLV